MEPEYFLPLFGRGAGIPSAVPNHESVLGGEYGVGHLDLLPYESWSSLHHPVLVPGPPLRPKPVLVKLESRRHLPPSYLCDLLPPFGDDMEADRNPVLLSAVSDIQIGPGQT